MMSEKLGKVIPLNDSSLGYVPQVLSSILSRLASLEARQQDTRHLAWILALGVLLGILLVLVGAAIFAGLMR